MTLHRWAIDNLPGGYEAGPGVLILAHLARPPFALLHSKRYAITVISEDGIPVMIMAQRRADKRAHQTGVRWRLDVAHRQGRVQAEVPQRKRGRA